MNGNSNSKNGMGLLQAIAMILIISGMMLVVLKYAAISSKHTYNSFIREQSELFLNSTIEQTLLAISFQNRASDGCLPSYQPTSVTKRGITYSADVNIIRYYLQKGSNDLSECSTGVEISDKSESHGMALFEVEVNATRADGTLLSRIIRRTLQQP